MKMRSGTDRRECMASPFPTISVSGTEHAVGASIEGISGFADRP
jgi:hypothetical protein